jgi:hypothetical protein
MNNQAKLGITQTQAYLFAYVVRIDELAFEVELAIQILKHLIDHEAWEEIVQRLHEAIVTSDGQSLIKIWMDSAENPSHVARLKQLID